MNRATYNQQHTDLNQQITALAGTLQQRESALTADWQNDKLLADATQAKLKLEAAQRALQALEAQEPLIRRAELQAQQSETDKSIQAAVKDIEKLSGEIDKLKTQLREKEQRKAELNSLILDYRHTQNGINSELNKLQAVTHG